MGVKEKNVSVDRDTKECKDKATFNISRATKEGRIYIKTSDFFTLDKVRATIGRFMESEIVKEIDERKEVVAE